MFLSWSWNKALWKQRSVQNGFQDQCFQKQRNLGGNSDHWKNIEIQTILKVSMVSRWFGTNAWQEHFATMVQKMVWENPFQWVFTWFYNALNIFLLKPFDPAPSVWYCGSTIFKKFPFYIVRILWTNNILTIHLILLTYFLHIPSHNMLGRMQC